MATRRSRLIGGVKIDNSVLLLIPSHPENRKAPIRAIHDFLADFQPSEYNVLSKRRVNRRYGFDVLVARADSEEYRRYVGFFQQVRLEPGRKKGILRISL